MLVYIMGVRTQKNFELLFVFFSSFQIALESLDTGSVYVLGGLVDYQVRKVNLIAN